MSSETLRRAAAAMRERAEAATPGPWSWDLSQDRHWALVMHNDPARDPRPIASSSDDDDAEHIASWHPAVALAVAGFLDAIAHRQGLGSDIRWPHPEDVEWAEQIAHAYLGEA